MDSRSFDRQQPSIGERFEKVKLDAGQWIADTHL